MNRSDAWFRGTALVAALASVITGVWFIALTERTTATGVLAVILAAAAVLAGRVAARQGPTVTGTCAAPAMAGASFALLLLGALSFGPVFLPSLILWGAAALVGWRRSHPPRLSAVTAILWGFGGALVLTSLVAFIPHS